MGSAWRMLWPRVVAGDCSKYLITFFQYSPSSSSSSSLPSSSLSSSSLSSSSLSSFSSAAAGCAVTGVLPLPWIACSPTLSGFALSGLALSSVATLHSAPGVPGTSERVAETKGTEREQRMSMRIDLGLEFPNRDRIRERV